jgi:murein DD-endopeptidase MepM/ murein hydrolase activator NlpD
MPPAFHPVVRMPADVPVLDLTRPWAEGGPVWAIGRYDEDRAIYTTPLFGGRRTVHVGIDLGGPAGVAVHAPCDGTVVEVGVNPDPGDYGPTLVTEHEVDGALLWILFGHLSNASLAHSRVGRRFLAGDVLGWLGTPDENGGYPPHVHVQLAVERPVTHDLPGAVAPEDRAGALRRYPDPRRILGPIY